MQTAFFFYPESAKKDLLSEVFLSITRTYVCFKRFYRRNEKIKRTTKIREAL